MAEAWVLVLTPELTVLTAVLALALVQLLLPAMGRTAANGWRWAAGPRDRAAERGRVVQRLERAQANLFETLPIFIALVLLVHVTGEEGPLSFWATQAYFWARLAYVPLYALGSPGRSLVWLVAAGGIVALFAALLT